MSGNLRIGDRCFNIVARTRFLEKTAITILTQQYSANTIFGLIQGGLYILKTQRSRYGMRFQVVYSVGNGFHLLTHDI